MNSQRALSGALPLVAGRTVREIGLVGAGLLIYFLIRGNVTDRAAQAVRNAIAVIDAQRALGIFWEPQMQAAILESAVQVRLWNWVYFWAHAPAIVIIGLWLLWRHPQTYTLVRNAFIVSAVLGLVCYMVFPVAPPRLVSGYGFVDTMLLYSQVSYQAQSLKPFVNPYAAMPSLHLGWAVLCGAGVFLVWRDVRGLVVGMALPLLMGLAIVLTANHYILDGVAGLVVAVIGLVVAVWWDRRRPRLRRRSMPVRRRTGTRPIPTMW
jgi:membrane-associated phospholipid phosphatase